MTIRFDSQTRARIAADLRQHYASGDVEALLAQIRREAEAHRVELDGVRGVVHLPAVRGAAVRVHLAGEW